MFDFYQKMQLFGIIALRNSCWQYRQVILTEDLTGLDVGVCRVLFFSY